MTIVERIQLWRADAAVLRRRGARRAAALLERVAAELETDLHDAPKVVDLARAVELTGYTRGHLRRLVLAGKLANVGTAREPAFIASDLPRKARQTPSVQALAQATPASASLRVQVARAVVAGD